MSPAVGDGGGGGGGGVCVGGGVAGEGWWGGEEVEVQSQARRDPTPSFLWYKVRDGVPSVILQGSNDTLGQSDK